jgi:hypothetical protein
MQELVFGVSQEADGAFVAASAGEGVITEADTWDELRHNVREAVKPISSTARRRHIFDFIWYATKCSPPDETAARS